MEATADNGHGGRAGSPRRPPAGSERAAGEVAAYVRRVVGPGVPAGVVAQAVSEIRPVAADQRFDPGDLERVRSVAVGELERQVTAFPRRLGRLAKLRFGCTAVPRLLVARATGRIPTADAARLYRHLDGCLECAELAGRFEAAEWKLRGLRATPAAAPAAISRTEVPPAAPLPAISGTEVPPPARLPAISGTKVPPAPPPGLPAPRKSKAHLPEGAPAAAANGSDPPDAAPRPVRPESDVPPPARTPAPTGSAGSPPLRSGPSRSDGAPPRPERPAAPPASADPSPPASGRRWGLGRTTGPRPAARPAAPRPAAGPPAPRPAAGPPARRPAARSAVPRPSPAPAAGSAPAVDSVPATGPV
ncbi:MAG: hypothetical protein QOE44_2322, partial [Solirubrobacteraceae bacterium]|nr:hypothetical protein [Solirubrobacteraceae bacterium]